MPLFRRRRKLARADSEWDRLTQLLERHEITLVIDVGANVGQYGERLRHHGYAGRIVSFEPGVEAHALLRKRAHSDPRWDVAPRIALGSSPGSARLQVNNRSDMNSLLPMTEETHRAFPDLKSAGEEEVEVARLDAVIGSFFTQNDTNTVFLKIDTQGYEADILAGSKNVMDKIAGLQVEMSLMPLYSGETIYLELLQKIRALGFEPHLFMGGYFSRRLARQLQIDGIFFRV